MSAMGTITVVGGFFTIWAFILTWNSRRNHKFQKEVLDKMDAHLEKLAQLVKDGQVFLAQIGKEVAQMLSSQTKQLDRIEGKL